MIPSPGWEPYGIVAHALGLRVLTYDPQQVVHELTALRPALARHSVVILNFPNNPTGAELSQSALNAVVSMVKSRGAVLIADEVYRTYADEPASVLLSPAFDPRTDWAVESASKWLAAAALRVGFLVSAPANISRVSRFRSTCASGTSLAGQRLAQALLSSPASTAWLTQVRTTTRRQTRALACAIAERGGDVRGHGALYVWMAMSGQVSARVVDGKSFGGSGMIRICSAREQLDVQAVAQRLMIGALQ